MRSGVEFSWLPLLLVHCFGVFDQLFIVYSNDVADYESDRQNATYNAFSGGSRVLVEGKLTRAELSSGARIAALGMTLVTLVLAFGLGRPAMPLFAFFSVALMWAYSFSPLRLSYRGNGEFLQAAGLGVVLPVAGFYTQAGHFSLPWLALLPAALLGYAGNLVTALPDFPSDRRSNKRTFAVRWGQRPARVVALLVIGLAVLGSSLVVPDANPILRAAVFIAPMGFVAAASVLVTFADADRRAACRWFVIFGGAAISSAFVLSAAAWIWASP